MTDIIKVAKKFGAHAYCNEVVDGVRICRADFGVEELQSFADHYRKKGAEEASKTIEEQDRMLSAEISAHENTCKQLTAAELVMEQMRVQAQDILDTAGSDCSCKTCDAAKTVLQLQPSLSALREHDAKVLEKAAVIAHNCCASRAAQEIRMAASPEKYIRCEHCSGKGYLSDGFTSCTCDWCNGTGASELRAKGNP